MTCIQIYSFTGYIHGFHVTQSFVCSKENVLPISLLIPSSHVLSFLKQCWHNLSPETKKTLLLSLSTARGQSVVITSCFYFKGC